MMSPLRWGIASAGKISFDFAVALSTLPSDEHQLNAVAARQKDRAEDFAKLHDIPHSYGSYVELAKSSEVDVVYVGTLNPQHLEVALLMLENGKHVLCEKPLCMNLKQVTKLIQYAESKKLFLMEGVWSRFFPSYQYVRKQIDSGVLGTIQQVDVAFGFPLESVDRLQKRDIGGGTVLDLGIYTIQVSQWAFQEPPLKIVAEGELNSEGVDIDVKIVLHYTGNRVANMHISAKDELSNKVIIKGTKGEISLPTFWCPTKVIDIDGKEKEWVLPKGNHATKYLHSEGLRYEADGVRDSILSGATENSNVKHNDSLLFSKIQDEIRRQIGVKYDCD